MTGWGPLSLQGTSLEIVIEKAKSEKIAEKIGSCGLPPAVIAALYAVL